MRVIYINENKLPLLKESKEDVTFYKFFTEVKNFIKDLLDSPIEAKPSGFFKSHGISRSLLINKMLDRDIIKKDEDVNERDDADGILRSVHNIKYNVPRKNFEQKIHRLYSYFFESSKKKVNESFERQKYNSCAVYIFANNENDELCILAGKRRGTHYGGLYNVITGHIGDIYYGESPLDAAVRETKEEAGLNIPPSLFKDCGDETYESRYGTQLGKNYIVKLDKCIEPGQGDNENDKLQWIALEAIYAVQWAFNMDKTIKKLVNNL